MTAPISNDPLHGVTLEMQVNALVARYGWNELGNRIKINCFRKDPSVKSSLKFLRRTPWARAEVEALYLDSLHDDGNEEQDEPAFNPRTDGRTPRANTQMMRHVKRTGALLGCALLLVSCTSKPPKSLVTPLPQAKPVQQTNEPMRGIWLATVSRLDWPPVSSVNGRSADQRIAQQQKALTDKLDKLKKLGINTVFFQVKPDSTALWASEILPWSDTLTGTIGEDPGYDPLQFMLDEAHKRGMKVHAWFNPYRVSTNTKPSTIAALNRTSSLHPSSVYVQHPEWIRTSGDRFVLDPGIPEVRDWITRW